MTRWISTGGIALATLVSTMAGCSDDEATGSGSLLVACTSDSDCGSPLTCECGVCTRACMDATECAAVRADATCQPTAGFAACGASPRAVSVCAVLCTTDTECAGTETCLEGRCRGDSTPADAGEAMDSGVPDGSMPDGSGSDSAVTDAGPVDLDATSGTADTGARCDGACAPGYPDGEPCNEDADCQSRLCTGVVRKTCTRPAGCGDGVLSLEEQCDDGDSVDNDWCSNGCLVATCEDGVLNGDETAIDDGGYCAFPERDVCRRAEFVPLDPYSVVGGVVQLFTRNIRTFEGASNGRAPSCGADGLDQAFRFAVQRETRLTFEAFAWDDAEPDVVQPVSVSVTRGCDGAEIACAFADRGFFGAGTPEMLFEPGEYIVWIEVGSEGKADRYEFFVYGEHPL